MDSLKKASLGIGAAAKAAGLSARKQTLKKMVNDNATRGLPALDPKNPFPRPATHGPKLKTTLPKQLPKMMPAGGDSIMRKLKQKKSLPKPKYNKDGQYQSPMRGYAKYA